MRTPHNVYILPKNLFSISLFFNFVFSLRVRAHTSHFCLAFFFLFLGNFFFPWFKLSYTYFSVCFFFFEKVCLVRQYLYNVFEMKYCEDMR